MTVPAWVFVVMAAWSLLCLAVLVSVAIAAIMSRVDRARRRKMIARPDDRDIYRRPRHTTLSVGGSNATPRQ